MEAEQQQMEAARMGLHYPMDDEMDMGEEEEVEMEMGSYNPLRQRQM